MSNNIALSEVFQTELDRQMVEGLTSGWMELGSDPVIYNGGNTIRIPKIILQGLGNYDRVNGFVNGDVTLSWEEHTFSMDRGRSFSVDSMDADEANFAISAGVVLGEFQSKQVIPEIDSYRYSRIASKAITSGLAEGGYTPDVETILRKLQGHIAAIQDIIGEQEPLVITIPISVAHILDQANGIDKVIDIMEFRKGEVFIKVKAINGIPLIRVPSARMKTAYTFFDGTTAGQEAGGFAVDVSAKDINWLITSPKSVIGITKNEKPRIFEPTRNQKADAWKIDYRRYHELFIPDNKLDGIFACIKQAIL